MKSADTHHKNFKPCRTILTMLVTVSLYIDPVVSELVAQGSRPCSAHCNITDLQSMAFILGKNSQGGGYFGASHSSTYYYRIESIPFSLFALVAYSFES